jgi:LmbE family N-acetylglucosaminyl deacetylase
MKLDVRLNLEQPDGRVWLTEESRTAMVRVLRKLKPKIVLTHNTDDPHPDHAHTAQIVREGARLSSMRKYDEAENLGTIKVPIVAHTLHSRRVVPTFIVDISDFLEEKMNAIRAHASQFFRTDADEPETRLTHKMFLQQIEWRSHYFGSLIGVAAGEPFYVREALNVEDPIALLTRSMNIYS